MKRQTSEQRAEHHRRRLDAAAGSRARLAAALDWLRTELAGAPGDVADAYADAATHRLAELAAELNHRRDRTTRRSGAA